MKVTSISVAELSNAVVDNIIAGVDADVLLNYIHGKRKAAHKLTANAHRVETKRLVEAGKAALGIK